jgi:hypothetical protein
MYNNPIEKKEKKINLKQSIPFSPPDSFYLPIYLSLYLGTNDSDTTQDIVIGPDSV